MPAEPPSPDELEDFDFEPENQIELDDEPLFATDFDEWNEYR